MSSPMMSDGVSGDGVSSEGAGWRDQPVVVIGCGGLGVPAAWTLAHAGARRLRLIDSDHVDASNLHRQVLYGERDVGAAKVERLAAALKARFSGLSVETRRARVTDLTAADLLDGAVAVFEGSDDAACKFLVNDQLVGAWRAAAGPRVGVIAAAIARRGQWMTVTPAGACYRCLFEAPPPPASLATCETAGVLGPVVGHVGAAAARALVQELDGRWDPARSALVRWQAGASAARPARYARTAVDPATDCPCAAHR